LDVRSRRGRFLRGGFLQNLIFLHTLSFMRLHPTGSSARSSALSSSCCSADLPASAAAPAVTSNRSRSTPYGPGPQDQAPHHHAGAACAQPAPGAQPTLDVWRPRAQPPAIAQPPKPIKAPASTGKSAVEADPKAQPAAQPATRAQNKPHRQPTGTMLGARGLGPDKIASHAEADHSPASTRIRCRSDQAPPATQPSASPKQTAPRTTNRYRCVGGSGGLAPRTRSQPTPKLIETSEECGSAGVQDST